MRKISCMSFLVLAAVLFGCVPFASAQMQDNTGQTVTITQPPTRKIERPPADMSASELEERGDQLRGEKANLDALDYYQAALKKLDKGSGSAQVLTKMGVVQIQTQRFDDAKKSFQRAIKIDGKYATAYNDLGAVYHLNKKYGRAIKYYKKAIEIEPDSASFHSNVASAYYANKEVDKAVPEYKKAMEIDPDIFEHKSTVGVVAQMAPEDRAQYSYILAKMYAQAGQFDRALLSLRRAMEEGYKDVNNCLKDTEFAQLRKDPRFNDLMAQRPQAIP